MTLPSRTVSGRNSDGRSVDKTGVVDAVLTHAFWSCQPDGTIVVSRGVASVVRTGAGRYTVTFSEAVPGAAYVCLTGTDGAQFSGSYNRLAGSVQIYVGGTGVDQAHQGVVLR